MNMFSMFMIIIVLLFLDVVLTVMVMTLFMIDFGLDSYRGLVCSIML